MTAQGNDPWIGVHELTEFVFCERAGQIEHERQREDPGVDESPPVRELRGGPRWSRHAIERDLQRVMERIWICLSVLVVTGIAAWIAGHPLGYLVAAIVIFAVGRHLFERLALSLNLVAQRRAATEAEAGAPLGEIHEDVATTWWTMLASGFEFQRPEKAMRDERWRLAGKPWMVLSNGSLRIPVFRMRRFNPDRRRTLFDQHYVRMAAYCHLIEKCERAQSPYGMILLGNSHQAILVPNHPGWRKRFHDNLLGARSIAGHRQRARTPHRQRCAMCPVGKPFVHDGTRRDGLTIAARPRRADDGRYYHSTCGDRFGWVPPHSKAYDKGIS